MKKQDITYQDKLNELRLDISHPNSRGLVFILVEGKTDIRLFRKFFDLLHCKVESIPGGNPKVEECVYELTKPNRFVIGIRDADFINLMQTNPYPKDNIHITDMHDIEMMIVFEDESLKAVSSEYLGIPEVENARTRSRILKSIEMISYLKWLNNEENLNLKFDSGFRDLISFQTNTFEFETYLQRVLSKSPNAITKDTAIITEKIDNLKLRNPDLSQLTNGHDFISALSKYINEFGTVTGLGDNEVASALRIAFSFDHFSRTKLYDQIKRWSGINSTPSFIK